MDTTVKEGSNVLKRNLQDFALLKPNKKQKVSCSVTSDLNVLKASSPEPEERITSQNTLVATNTKSPNELFFPKYVTQEHDLHPLHFADAQFQECSGSMNQTSRDISEFIPALISVPSTTNDGHNSGKASTSTVRSRDMAQTSTSEVSSECIDNKRCDLGEKGNKEDQEENEVESKNCKRRKKRRFAEWKEETLSLKGKKLMSRLQYIMYELKQQVCEVKLLLMKLNNPGFIITVPA